MKKIILALILLMPLNVDAARLKKVLSNWLGATEAELVDQWGHPQSQNDIAHISDDVKVYSYRSSRWGITGYGSCTVSFTIKNGIVSRYTARGANCIKIKRKRKSKKEITEKDNVEKVASDSTNTCKYKVSLTDHIFDKETEFPLSKVKIILPVKRSKYNCLGHLYKKEVMSGNKEYIEIGKYVISCIPRNNSANKVSSIGQYTKSRKGNDINRPVILHLYGRHQNKTTKIYTIHAGCL